MRSFRDDPTGKSRGGDTKERQSVMATIYAVGVAIGLVMAYANSRGNLAKPRQLVGRMATNAISFGAAHMGAILPHTGAPRNDLEVLLRKIAPDHELLVAVANKNVNWDGMLETFISGITRAAIKNHLILALDQETVDFCDAHQIHSYLMKKAISTAQEGTGDNHAVSAMKFGILRQFLELGYSVLLSDVDIAILQDPFDHLYRDSDVEGMTDGFSDETAYGHIEGFDDPSMGWARFAQAYKHFNMNSGLFYVRANGRTLDMMTRLEQRLAKEKYWDQTAYNEALFFLSHGDYKSPQVTVRVMDIYKFMNSKLLFKDIRSRSSAERAALPKPVMVHINYHPDKHARMKAVVRYYIDGDLTALDKFPGGSEAGSRRR